MIHTIIQLHMELRESLLFAVWSSEQLLFRHRFPHSCLFNSQHQQLPRAGCLVFMALWPPEKAVPLCFSSLALWWGSVCTAAEQESFKSLTPLGHWMVSLCLWLSSLPSEQRLQISVLPYQRGAWGPWALLKPGLLGFGGELENRAWLLTCL